jgi:hypothetical protein
MRLILLLGTGLLARYYFWPQTVGRRYTKLARANVVDKIAGIRPLVYSSIDVLLIQIIQIIQSCRHTMHIM